jgi:hypothetical protein
MVLLEMAGQIKVGRWLPFRAIQVITSNAYLWVARAGWRFLRITGFDGFTEGEGEMRWLLAGRVPIMRATGTNIARSAAGRLAIDAMVFLPTLLPTLRWRPEDGTDIAVAEWEVAGETLNIWLSIDGDGRLSKAMMQRWGHPAANPGLLPLWWHIE